MGTSLVNGELWGARAAAWSEVQEEEVLPLYEAALTATHVGTGTALLDVGCGAGLALVLARRRGATVAGLDASEALIGVARTRLPGADLRIGDREDLPHPDDYFDVATAFNSLPYAADPQRALTEMARVVRAGGLVAVATWGQPEASQMTAVLGAVGPLLPPPSPGAAHGGPFALSAPGRLESFVDAAGLTTVSAAEVSAPMRYPDLDTALRGQASSGVTVLAERHSGHDAVTAALRTSLAPFTGSDGSVRLDNTFRFVVCQVQ
jgi:SAM-dependent methyltransferase